MAPNFVHNALGIFQSGELDSSPPPQPQRSLPSVHREGGCKEGCEEQVREEEVNEEVNEEEVNEEEVNEEEGAVSAEPPVSSDPPAPPTSPASPTYSLDASGMQVVDSLFYSPGVRGRPVLSWKAFKDMMNALGFTKENGNGTRRRFVPGQSAQERGWLAAVGFDRPHNDDVPFEWAREWGRRLKDRYGWSSQTFVRESR